MSRESKQKRSAERRRRAATCLQQVAWLRGYPDGDRWQVLGGEALVLDGALVSRSRRAARTALREHAAELSDLVGDVERWWRVVDAALAWCSAYGAPGAPSGPLELLALAPPRLARTAQTLSAQQPQLAPAIRAASVAWAQQPDELARALGWLAEHPEVGDLELGLQLQLLQLALLAVPGGGEALIALLLTDAPAPVPAREAVLALLSSLRDRGGKAGTKGKPGKAGTKGKPARPGNSTKAAVPARSLPKIVAWIGKLVRREPAAQRRALELLAVADLAGPLAQWAEWEHASAARMARAAAFEARSFDAREEQDNRVRIEAGLAAIRDATPPLFSIEEALDAIDGLSERPALTRFHAAVVRLLPVLPASLGPNRQARMLPHLDRCARRAENERTAWLWQALADALEAGAPERLLGPWRSALASKWQTWFDNNLVEHLPRRPDVQRLIAALAALAVRGEVSVDDAEATVTWLAAGLAEESIPEVVERLRDHKRDLSIDNARVARLLADATPAAIAATCATLLAAVEDVGWMEEKALRTFIERAVKSGAGWWVRGALAASQGAALTSLATTLELTPPSRWPAFTLAPDSSWIARYPEALAPALRRLAAMDPEAEQTARQRLGTDLPDPEQLREEIAALRARTPLAPSLATRLANLEARLAAPKLPSPQRLARLAGKLELSACMIGLARLGAAATREATARIVDAFGLERWPGWPLDRRMLQLMLGLLRLGSIDRALAGRLLRARTGPRPWDLRDDPANLAFLDQLRQRGLELEPWLDDRTITIPTTIPATVSTKQQPLQLALCSDPLEVFEMGAHFETCLSPGSINYFSVLANAADVNKRVLYARRDGRVVGRCLLAITDSGALLVFNPYCHEQLDFAAIVREYAVQLAARMRTSSVPRGAVSTILARDWYDDGPHDLVGRFEVLRDEAKLDLATIAPDALPARLRELTGHELDDLLLPLVLSLPGFQRRPELLLALAPALLEVTTPTTRVAAAELALRAGDQDLADRLLGEHADSIDLEYPAWPQGEVVARLRPSTLLARLRETRSRTVRGWSQEPGERIALAAVALETLRRPRQAAAMYRLAIERESYLREDLQPRLDALLDAAGLEAP